MSASTRMPLEYARGMAAALTDLLRSACLQIEVAGSIRRGKPDVGDIEIVCRPMFMTWQFSMFAGSGSKTTNILDDRCEKLLAQGILEKRPDAGGGTAWGERYKRAVFYHEGQHASADIFSVIKPAQWGVIYAIRTGPHEFNKLVVTSQWLGGLCPKDRKVAGGRVWDLTGLREAEQRHYGAMVAAKFAKLAERERLPVIPTPTEAGFFAALGLPWWEPEERTPEALVRLLW